jgi:glutamine amidotransferase
MKSSNRIAIVDYGVGNHQSVALALQKLGYKFIISHRADDLAASPALIFPGVGAFGEAMACIKERKLGELLCELVVDQKKPMLGICLGMQLLAEDSTEGGVHPGLGLVPGHVVAIPHNGGVKVPHVGWSNLQVARRDALFANAGEESSFYFDHSFHFECRPEHRAATVSYGHELVAAIQVGNIFGVQFHPEKSHRSGLKLFRSFFNHCGVSGGRPC